MDLFFGGRKLEKVKVPKSEARMRHPYGVNITSRAVARLPRSSHADPKTGRSAPSLHDRSLGFRGLGFGV